MIMVRLGQTSDKLHQTSIQELSLFPHEVYVRMNRRELPKITAANIPIHISADGDF